MPTPTSCQRENIGSPRLTTVARQHDDLTIVAPQLITVTIGDIPRLRVGSIKKGKICICVDHNQSLTSRMASLDLSVPGSNKHGRKKAARGDRDGVDVEVQHAESSSESAPAGCAARGLQSTVSELSDEIRGFKGQVLTLLGDMAMSDGVFTRNIAKDFVCKHCSGNRGLGDEGKQKLVEEWCYKLDSLEKESQIP